MTTVISRIYADEATADAVLAAMAKAGFPESTCDKISAGARAADLIRAARVPREDVDVYAAMLTEAATMVVVRAPVTPFGAARKAIEIVDSHVSVPVAVPSQSVYLRETLKRDLYIGQSILKDHPRWFSGDFQPGSGQRRSLLSEAFSWKLLSQRKPRSPAKRGNRYLSTRILPFPLLKDRSAGAPTGAARRFFYNP